MDNEWEDWTIKETLSYKYNQESDLDVSMFLTSIMRMQGMSIYTLTSNEKLQQLFSEL